MMRHWSFYREDDGAFTGESFASTIPDHHLAQLPAGCAAKEGAFDHLSQRVDLTDTAHPVIDWQPPQPSPDHEWNPEQRRWRLKPAAEEKAARRARARDRIRQLEQEELRVARVLLLEIAGQASFESEAHARLRELDREIREQEEL